MDSESNATKTEHPPTNADLSGTAETDEASGLNTAMIESWQADREAEALGVKPWWRRYGVLAATCAVVIGVYAYTAHSGYVVSASLDAADDYYNLLVQGFRAGQLNLMKEVPPGLARLADPYDPAAHFPFRVLDLSYYRGKLYLYFGVTPVLVLFWPYVALTGHYLLQKNAAVIFCAAGFLVSVGLLAGLWRRYFTNVSVGVVAACALALGLANGSPLLLARCDVHEVSIACGYAMTMLAVAGIWKALHESRTRSGWLAAASLAYGLAVGARPSLLPGAVILLVPVAQAWRERGKLWNVLVAATGPIVLIGLGLMLYNASRFDNPFEFGWRYQMAGDRQDTGQQFSLRYLWFNFRVYFLGLARWSSRFPYVHDIAVPSVPRGHVRVEHPFGVLTNIPLVWLALAVPLAWRDRSAEGRAMVGAFLGAVAVLFGICALTLGIFHAACVRYEMEFLAPLVLLAVVGYLSLERALAASSESRPVKRQVVRWGGGLLLGLSVVFNLLACVERCAEAHYALAGVLVRLGRIQEGIEQCDQALRLNPDYAEAHNNLAVVLFQQGQVAEAMAHWQQALRIAPDYPEMHNELGLALSRQGDIQSAIEHFEHALRIKPGLVEAHNNLGLALVKQGKTKESMEQFEQALRIEPDSADAQYNLGVALGHAGRDEEAVNHFEQALRSKPDYAESHNNLGIALARLGRKREAMVHWEQALRLKPDLAEAHYNLGIVLEQTGRVAEAIGHYEQALRLKPDYAEARERLGRLRAAQ